MPSKSTQFGLDTKLCTLPLPKGAPPDGKLFGVEIELEGWQSTNRDVYQCWTIHGENSLRNGVEFITYPAQPYSEREYVLGLFPKALKELSGAKPTTSIRCSTHVHINVGSLTFRQIAVASLLYYLFENPLIKTQHPFRTGNLFCLSLNRASYIADMLYESVQEVGNWQHIFSQNNAKYSALNLGNVFKLGTIEFRFLSPIIEPAELVFWVEVFQAIVDFAAKYPAAKLIELYNDLSLKEFMTLIWGDNAHELYDRFMQGINTTILTRSIHKNYDSIVEIAKLLGKKKFEIARRYWDPDDESIAPQPSGDMMFFDEAIDDFAEPDWDSAPDNE